MKAFMNKKRGITKAVVTVGVVLSSLAVVVGLYVPTQVIAGGSTTTRPEIITSPATARDLLVQGNKRYYAGTFAKKDLTSTRRSYLSTNGQHPFAVLVSCSDSRVPPEIVFDQALGDLFVVRVAGNVVDADAIGSVEYAIDHLKVPYILVMGHEKCGAVTAAVYGSEAPGSIGSILTKIQPSVSKAKATGATGNDLIELTASENVKSVVAQLKQSPIVSEALTEGKINIQGSKYDLDTGVVSWY